jgi:hypothetical protein
MMGSRKWLHTHVSSSSKHDKDRKQLEPIKILEEEKPKRELYHLVQKQVLDHKPLYFLDHKSFTDHAVARTK